MMAKPEDDTSKAVRSPIENWVHIPECSDQESWELFLACGQLLAMVVLADGGDWGPILLSQIPDLARHLPPDKAVPEESTNEIQRPRSARIARALMRDAQLERLGPAAFAILTDRPLQRFRFLDSPGAEIPTPAVVLIAALIARYVLAGTLGCADKFRDLFRLFDPRPGTWEGMGRALFAYMATDGAMLEPVRNGNTLCALDGAVALSSQGLRQILGFEISQEQPPRECPQPSRQKRGMPMAGDGEELSGPVLVSSSARHTLRAVILPPGLKSELGVAAALCRRRPKSPHTFLFSGPPGTGKTFAAEALAGTLGKKLATLSLAEVRSRFVGDTEKRLAQAFRDAEAENALLLIDEADALLNSRETATQTWELSHVSALLKLLEEPLVPVVLCTNFTPKLDPALHRRIVHMITFRVPGPEERASIWTQELKRARIREVVDLQRLASIPLTGGLIANAVRQADGRRALNKKSFPISTESLLNLAKKELPKMGEAIRVARRSIGFGCNVCQVENETLQ